MEAVETVASPELYRWERRLVVAGFIAPLPFLIGLNGTLFANSASLPCAAALIVEYLLAQKTAKKYQENIVRAEEGWYAMLSAESHVLHRKCLALGIYGVLLWGFGAYPVSWLAAL